jgi:hypothetical protein
MQKGFLMTCYPASASNETKNSTEVSYIWRLTSQLFALGGAGG